MKIPSIRNIDKDLFKIVIGIYLPGFFIQLGNSLVLAFDPLYSRELGADLGMIGLIAAAGGIGHLIFDLPGGWLGGKIKEKTFLLFSVAGLILFIFLKAIAKTPAHLFITSLFIGMFTAAWAIGRVSYVRHRVPGQYRGRALAFLAGIMRVTRIIGPVMGGLLIRFFGFRPIYFIQGGLAVIALILVSILLIKSDPVSEEKPDLNFILKATFRENGRNIFAAILGITGLMIIRMSRNLLVPLWAVHIGITVELLGVLMSIGGIIETVMVLPAGNILDTLGRKWTAVPSTLGLSLGLILMPLTTGFVSLTIVFCFMAVSNGLGSGIAMTISSDLSPKKAASEFLGIWRFLTDTSQVTGPIIAAFVAQAFALSFAPLAAGGIGLAAGFILLFGMKETKKTDILKSVNE